MPGMKAIALLFALLTATVPAHAVVPTDELFLILPQDVVKMTVTNQGDWQKIDVVGTKDMSAKLQAFSQRNLGKPAGFGLVQKNKDGSPRAIELMWVNLTAPIKDGTVHLRLTNPDHRVHGAVFLAE
jgi:hypothetical protein